MYTSEEADLIVLCSLEELSYKLRHMLLNGLTCPKPDFAKYGQIMVKSLSSGVYNKVKGSFYSEDYRKSVFESLKRRGITCVTIFSENYPELLKNTPFPPIVLFCKGDISLLKTRCFSVVGSRCTLPDVAAACKKLCGELTQQFTIVTGIADGADSAALAGALKSGKVISVLAHGGDYCYPSYNRRILSEVESRGLVISELFPDTPPRQYMFPVRNRIIAGLSEGTLVVSAGKKSGALITAEYAYEYGRLVFAFPYGIGVSSGEGCNGLLKKGGILTENILDIFSVFGLDFKILEKSALSDGEEKLLNCIKAAGNAFVPDLAQALGRQPYQLIPLLSSLEIKGLVVRLGGNRYSAVG